MASRNSQLFNSELPNPMRFLLPLLASSMLFAACDGLEPAETFSGPTVEFATSSLSVSEDDGTVEIPVRLTGGTPSTSVTVEVLYAAASSTTDFGDDVSGFGSADGANQVATVTLSGETDTQTVTIDIETDDEAEDAEAAVFVLQKATGDARIGDARQFRIEIGTPPISAARAQDEGAKITIEGIVTSAAGRFSFIQDASAAIVVFAFDDSPYGAAVQSGAVSVGDRVQIVGTRGEFRQQKQLVDPTTFKVLSSDNPLPDAQEITLAQMLTLGEDIVHERVRIDGLTITDPAGAVVFQRSQTVSDGTSPATMFLQSESEATDAVVPAGGTFTYEGPVSQFEGTNQLGPLSPCEIVELRDDDDLDCTAYTR